MIIKEIEPILKIYNRKGIIKETKINNPLNFFKSIDEIIQYVKNIFKDNLLINDLIEKLENTKKLGFNIKYK